jgi:hypothetical protein
MGRSGHVRFLVCAAAAAIVCASGGAAHAASSPSVIMPDGSVRYESGTPLVGTGRADAKYTLRGDMTLAPETVFNDGARTFVRWKALPDELPRVFSVGKDGTAQAVDFRVVGSAYVIDGLNPAYDLVVPANGDRRGRLERRVSIRHI